MRRVMTVRLYPNRLQAARLTHFLNVGRWVFNRCLELKRRVWKEDEFNLTRFDLNHVLTLWRKTDPAFASVPARVERDAIRRVDLAFQHFFRRVKEQNDKAGYPRFKPATRYNSFTISQPWKPVVSGRIRVQGIDTLIRCRNLRPIDGTVKQLRVVRRADRWFAQLVVEKPDMPTPPREIRREAGLDVGLNSFIRSSDGFNVPAPQFYRKLERKLRRAGRRVSRKRKGSANRRKAVQRLQRVHLRIADARWNFTHHLSKQVVAQYDLIAIEKLNVAGMAQSRLAKSILDAAWGQFLFQLRYKAASAGAKVVEVDPRGTSQECSACGTVVPKDLSVRVHDCPHCGLVLDRDENAARNILKRATAGGAGSHACGDRPVGAVIEAGSPS